MQCDRSNNPTPGVYKGTRFCCTLRSRSSSVPSEAAGVMSEEAFATAVKEAKELPSNFSVEDMGVLYGLYKQVNVGDVNVACPSIIDFVGRKKWFAWKSREGLSKQDAKEAYIVAVEQFKVKYRG